MHMPRYIRRPKTQDNEMTTAAIETNPTKMTDQQTDEVAPSSKNRLFPASSTDPQKHSLEIIHNAKHSNVQHN
jgi:hypothetical protein